MKGFMKTRIMIVISIFALCLSSCGGVAKTVKEGGTTAVDSFIECAKADIGRTIPEVGLTILAVVTQILMAGEGNYVAKLDEIGDRYGNDAEACAVKAVNTALSSGSSTPSHTMSPALGRSAAVIKTKGWKFKVE